MSTTLSTLAERYLKSLARLPMPLTERVEKELKAEGLPAMEPWLEFHERYAGYVEQIWHDRAVWGLLHFKPRWQAPKRLAYFKDFYEEQEHIIINCADVHPSYEYQLDEKGMFSRERSRYFDIYVEQSALHWWFTTQIGPEPLHRKFDLKDPRIIDKIRSHSEMVEEASDEFSRVFLGDSVLAYQDAETDHWVQVLSRGDFKLT
ncbi:MAG: hypothetical protein PVI92_15430 [Chromatiales bacterium]